ncbi:MAG: glycosyltransferase family 1 protein [Chloroflexi bacterium AL-N5]|nr:glycosyltransferase family 1 protein [Chloroflexi bacterium AL-N5]
MKILQVGMDWFPDKQRGGLERFFYDFTTHLPQEGVETISLVTGPAGVIQSSQGTVQAFAPRDSSIISRVRGVRQSAQQLLRSQEFSLYASHFVLYTFPILKQLQDRPLVMHFHGPWSLESVVESRKSLDIWFRRYMERSVYTQSTRFIVLSQAFKDILHQRYDIPLEKIHIVPGAVDIERFESTLTPEQAREKLEWSQDRPIVFTARRLSTRMGLDNLVEAMHKVVQEHPDILLLIAGKGDQQAILTAQISALGLDKNITLLGYLSDQELALAYRAATFSVIPTATLEGFGLVVLESLAAGTPMMGTPIGGIPETLRPFCEDLVFDGAESHHIANGIIEALSGDRHLPSSEACEAHVKENYTWPVITRRIIDIYQTVIDQHS